MTLRLWEGLCHRKSSITNMKVFIKLDGEFWPWKEVRPRKRRALLTQEQPKYSGIGAGL